MMATEKRLIDANAFKVFLEDVRQGYLEEDTFSSNFAAEVIETVQDNYLDLAPTVDAVEVVHGRWERCGGDLHSSGYAVYCSVCHKNHFVHYKHSLGGLFGCKELFEKPKYCPSCGAVMENEE